MTTTFTIKQVPDHVADALRARAATNRRSLQRELLLLIEEAAARSSAARDVAQPGRAYTVSPAASAPARRKGTGNAAASDRLTLDQLWARVRALGTSSPSESAAIVRRDRDARHGH